VTSKYVLRPQADADLDEHAWYLASKGTPELGHRFLVAAHHTFALLATHPAMGWHFRFSSPRLGALRVFRVSGFEKMLVLYLPTDSGIEIVRVIHGSRNIINLVID
jgi:toxin ParE1/3/4